MLLKTKDKDVQFIELAESELPAGGLRVTCEDENPKRMADFLEKGIRLRDQERPIITRVRPTASTW